MTRTLQCSDVRACEQYAMAQTRVNISYLPVTSQKQSLPEGRAGADTVGIVTKRRYARLTAIGAAALACCLLLSVWITVQIRDAAAARGVSSALIAQHPGPPAGRTRTAAVSAPLDACEARLEQQPHRVPTLAIVGASYTAGIGPDNPELSWAVDLARLLRWNAVIYGVPGAGYVRPGNGGRGPVDHMLRAEGLAGLSPALVIIQAGRDDLGVPAGQERHRVDAAVNLIKSAAPRARIGLLTTFSGTPEGTPALRATDHAIVTGGGAADPRVIVMDPLAGQWRYPHANGGLHPTAAGDQWIARTAAAILRAHGVQPAPATSAAASPVVCDVTVGAAKPAAA
jgi:GDSL-like Lipase/Acylhydrolase family